MDAYKYVGLAKDIHKLFEDGFIHDNGRIEAYEPAEFQMALELALAIYIKAQFPNEVQEILKLHCQSFELILEDVNSITHPDDRMSISGFKL